MRPSYVDSFDDCASAWLMAILTCVGACVGECTVFAIITQRGDPTHGRPRSQRAQHRLANTQQGGGVYLACNRTTSTSARAWADAATACKHLGAHVRCRRLGGLQGAGGLGAAAWTHGGQARPQEHPDTDRTPSPVDAHAPAAHSRVVDRVGVPPDRTRLRARRTWWSADCRRLMVMVSFWMQGCAVAE